MDNTHYIWMIAIKGNCLGLLSDVMVMRRTKMYTSPQHFFMEAINQAREELRI